MIFNAVDEKEEEVLEDGLRGIRSCCRSVHRQCFNPMSFTFLANQLYLHDISCPLLLFHRAEICRAYFPIASAMQAVRQHDQIRNGWKHSLQSKVRKDTSHRAVATSSGTPHDDTRYFSCWLKHDSGNCAWLPCSSTHLHRRHVHPIRGVAKEDPCASYLIACFPSCVSRASTSSLHRQRR